ncbi:MAG TPA: sigma 54-interacting transcriptional regulator [Syntrophorhabdaceae bacterium]|nr:sigma 54-interacting transcriptional regulator [Syntrophorhabdaceae bacterium]HQM80565.1 sigma 54-interacting transcriptional regulator [Syntrophorhabdaceae bacterium]
MKNKERQDLLAAIEPYPYNPVIASVVKFCFKNRYESITVIDKNYIIQFIDPPTEKFLGLQPGGGIGKNILELAPASDYQLAITTGTPVIGRVREVGEVKRVTSVYPLRTKGEIVGAIGRIVFHPLEELEKVHKEITRLKNEMHNLKQRQKTEYSSAYTFDSILGKSWLIRDTVATAKRISMLDADVLIEGESGTGKELFAHSIHSYRCNDKPFVKLNCPAIPFELAESQLFGYEKGAYTGANSSGKAGIFETANNGIVFLDEISSLPLSIQAKLLRVLQEREIQRLGSNKAVKVNFRFIAATNVDLRKLVEEGKFRHDLYYRVASASLHAPSLRERPEDIPLYLHSFLDNINKSFKTNIRGYTKEALDKLISYQWPGNVRQLIHILEQIAITAWDAREIALEHLPREILSPEDQETGFAHVFSAESRMPEKDEKNLILSVLERTKGNKRQAAILLNMSRVTLYKKMKLYNIITK